MSAHPPTMFALPRLMALVLIAGMLGMLSCAPSPQLRIIPLTHSAYVWKQGWNARMTSELAGMELPSKLTALNVLVGECGLSSGRRAVRPPWKELSAHGRPLSLSVRIGTRKAVLKTGELDLAEGFDLLLAGLAEASSTEFGPSAQPVVGLIQGDVMRLRQQPGAGQARNARADHGDASTGRRGGRLGDEVRGHTGSN